MECVRYIAKHPEPTYLRLGKAGEPDLTSNAEPFVYGVPRLLKRGSSHLIAGYGPILSKASQIDPEASVVSIHSHPATLHPHSRLTVLEDHKPFLLV